jgi:hypothetical protein
LSTDRVTAFDAKTIATVFNPLEGQADFVTQRFFALFQDTLLLGIFAHLAVVFAQRLVVGQYDFGHTDDGTVQPVAKVQEAVAESVNFHCFHGVAPDAANGNGPFSLLI